MSMPEWVFIVLVFKTENGKENHGQASAPHGAMGLKPDHDENC